MSMQVMARKSRIESNPIGSLTNNRKPTNSSSRIRQLQACCTVVVSDPISISSSSWIEGIKDDCSGITPSLQPISQLCKCPHPPQTSKDKLSIAASQGELIESRKAVRCGTTGNKRLVG
jgi:hypothetical protein